MSLRDRLGDELAAVGLALQFLTRVPVSSSAWYSASRSAASVRYYPLVGAIVGVVAALAWAVGATLFEHPALSALLATAATLLFTGAFHEDGLADTCDGIGGGLTRERSLAIMRDSRLGTYGTCALVLVLALKVAALAAFGEESTFGMVLAVLVGGHASSRASSVLVVATSAYVREEGTAKPVAKGVDGASLLVVLLSTGLVLGALYYAVPEEPDVGRVLGAAVGLLAGHLGARAFFEPKLGGYTGDCLGCVQQLSELGLYLGVLALA